jgi:O-antigen ligase
MQATITSNPLADAKAGLIACLLISGLVLSVLIAVTLPGLPTTVAFSLMALTFSFFRIKEFLYFVILFMPLAPVVETGLPLRNISSFVEFLMFVGFALSLVREGKSVVDWVFGTRLNRLTFLFGAVVITCTYCFNHTSVSSLRACSELAAALCLFFTVGGWIQTRAEVMTILRIVLTSSILVSAFGFYQAIIQNYSDFYVWLYPNLLDNLEPWTGRISSVLNYSNSLAGFLNLILPISLGLLLIRSNPRDRLLAGIALGCGAVALVLTASRGGFASFLAELILAAIYLARQATSTRKWLLIAGMVTAALGLILFFGFIRTPWLEEDQSAAMRLLFWGFAATLFFSSPIVGVGYGNFRDLYDIPGIAPGIFDVHNIYLQLLAETGLVGFIAFFFMVIHVIRKCVRTLKTRSQDLKSIINFAALGAVISVLLHGFVDFLFIVSSQFTLLFWLILALVVVAERWTDSEQARARSAEFAS